MTMDSYLENLISEFQKECDKQGVDSEPLLNAAMIRMAMVCFRPIRTMKTASAPVDEILSKYSFNKKLLSLATAILVSTGVLDAQDHVVCRGDTFWNLSKKYGISVEDIEKANPGIDARKLQIGQKINIPNDEKNIDFMAHVLYGETGTHCSDQEKQIICNLIKNRIGLVDFGNHSDPLSVMSDKSQFTCIEDKNNSSWSEYNKNLNDDAIKDYEYAEKMYKNDFSFISIPDNYKSVLIYHDNRNAVNLERVYDERYYALVRIGITNNFSFYTVIPVTDIESRKEEVNNNGWTFMGVHDIYNIPKKDTANIQQEGDKNGQTNNN